MERSRSRKNDKNIDDWRVATKIKIQKWKYVPTLIETDLFLDTNTVACSHPFVVVDAIAAVLDGFAFAAAYDRPNVAVSDPTALE